MILKRHAALNQYQVRHASLTRQRSLYKTHQRHRSVSCSSQFGIICMHINLNFIIFIGIVRLTGDK